MAGREARRAFFINVLLLVRLTENFEKYCFVSLLKFVHLFNCSFVHLRESAKCFGRSGGMRFFLIDRLSHSRRQAVGTRYFSCLKMSSDKASILNASSVKRHNQFFN